MQHALGLLKRWCTGVDIRAVQRVRHQSASAPSALRTVGLVVAVLVVGLVALQLTGGAGSAQAAATTPTSTTATKDAKATTATADATSSGGIDDFESDSLDLDTSSSPAKAASSSSGGALLRMIIGLGVVVGLIFAVKYFLKRAGRDRTATGLGDAGTIEVLSTTALSQTRALHLVRVGGELVLIGATDGGIARLGAIDAQQLHDAAGNAGDAAFQQQLGAAMSTSSNPGASTSRSSSDGGSRFGWGSRAPRPAATAPATPASPQGSGSFVSRFVSNLQLMTSR